MRRRHGQLTAAVVIAWGVATLPGRADVFRDLGYGLAYAGFNIEGNRNYLSGGYDFLINHNFVGNPLNFGTGDLTLLGPVSLSATTGNRILNTFDISLRTAVNATSPAVPLNYQLRTDVGSQSAQIAGTMFVDADLSVNGFGFYDLELTYSSRQEVNRQGRFSDDDDAYDLDLGPIDVSGNIFADVLAALTDPFFEGADLVNPFASFSGPDSLSALARDSTVDLYGLATGKLQDTEGVFAPVDAKLIAALNPGGDGGRAQPRALNAVVPEPPVVFLVLLGIPVVLLKPLRHRLAAK